MSTDENKRIVRRFFELGPSQGDMNSAKKLLTEDFALHVPLPSAPGVQGISDIVTACRAAFEHLNVTVEDMVAEGDRVAARFTARGVHKGEFMGLAPTGKPITMTGIEIFRLENGKIAELWGEANLMGLMMQLGILPAVGGKG